jgi:hypothetical protein
MNEIQIIRSQLAAEQSHAAQVANACAAAFGERSELPSGEAAAQFREACIGYLVGVLARFEERDQTLSELLPARQFGALLNQPGTSREALSRLEAALAAGDSSAAPAAWQEFARFFNRAWVPRRVALERALAEHPVVADWRTLCAIDADSILDERNRYARIRALLPPGIELRQAPCGG